MTCRERLEKFFREQGVKYEAQSHPEVYTAQEVAAVEHVPGRFVAKVVMAVVDGKLTELVLPAPYRVDMAKLRAALSAREARLAREEEFAGVFPDCEVGAMPPLGNLYHVPVVVDKTLTQDLRMIFNAGTHRDTMAIALQDFSRLVNPRIVDFSVTSRAR
jgi:Ala-tRNA(Pro) deacylase